MSRSWKVDFQNLFKIIPVKKQEKNNLNVQLQDLGSIQNQLSIFNEFGYKFYRIDAGNVVIDEAVNIWIKELYLIFSI